MKTENPSENRVPAGILFINVFHRIAHSSSCIYKVYREVVGLILLQGYIYNSICMGV
jgi:hypothetical protein